MLYVSLHRELGEERWLYAAEELVGTVELVLGRPRGLRTTLRRSPRIP